MSEGTRGTRSDAGVDSYQIVLPPGWDQYPVRPGIADVMYDRLRRVVEPTGNTQLLAQLRTMTRRSMKELRQNGGIDVFLPRRRPDEVMVPASMTSARVALGDRGVEAAVLRLAAGREAEQVETPVGLAYAWRSASRGEGDLKGAASENAFCLFPLPGTGGQTGVIFTFSILRLDTLPDEYVEILWLIFDAMMQSLGWVYRDDD